MNQKLKKEIYFNVLPSSHIDCLILMYLTLPFLLFQIKMILNLLSTRLSTLEAQKRLHDKQPQAEQKKKGVLMNKNVYLSSLLYNLHTLQNEQHTFQS